MSSQALAAGSKTGEPGIEIVMPRMGLTMETGTVVRWLKNEGQAVEAGEPLLEIETDKATAEIEALESGVLDSIIAGPGETREVGAVIGWMRKPGAKPGSIAAPLTLSAPAIPVASPVAPIPIEKMQPPSSTGKVKASPAARRLAHELGVHLSQVTASGPGGRVVAWNVEASAASSQKSPGPLTVGANTQEAVRRVSPVARRVAADLGVDLSGLQGSGPGGMITRQDVEQASKAPVGEHAISVSHSRPAGEIEPFTRIQRVMAERMLQSFNRAPHFYLHVEVDARRLVALRQQLLPRLEQRAGVHLTYTDLLIYFCACTLPRHPQMLKQWTGEGLIKQDHIHIGIAVDTEAGLLVPVLCDADRLGLVEIAHQRADLAERARQGKLLPQEFEEGVFTLTNLGAYNIDSFDAILNPPQAAILAVGRIKERALVENGQLVAASMMNLSLSVDHRVLDGSRAARFLGELAEMIEMPGLSMA